jgi:hypothetical protein
MNLQLLRTLCAAILPALLCAGAHGQKIPVQVQISATALPADVDVERQSGGSQIGFARVPNENVFFGVVPRPTPEELTAAKRVAEPYVLVANWSDGTKELVYLALNGLTPDIRLRVFHEPVGDDLAALRAIAALQSDLDSNLKQYFKARTFHRKWRYEIQQPDTEVAIQSARIWFDAAVNLVKRDGSYFRMDDEVRDIFRDYEMRAIRDSGLNRRLRKYVNSGYVSATMEQTTAAPYHVVAAVPQLVKAGKIEEAQAVNGKALAALESEPREVQRIVEKRQGVNVDLLRNNAAFLSSILH